MTTRGSWNVPFPGRDPSKAKQLGLRRARAHRANKKGNLIDAINDVRPQRVKVDSNLIDYVKKWKEGVGSGAATRELLEHITKAPEQCVKNHHLEAPTAKITVVEAQEG